MSQTWGSDINYLISRPPHPESYQFFGKSICDFVQHVAKAYKIYEDEVWHWVDDPTGESSYRDLGAFLERTLRAAKALTEGQDQ